MRQSQEFQRESTLVVVAIIGLLRAILMPALVAAIQSGTRRTSWDHRSPMVDALGY